MPKYQRPAGNFGGFTGPKPDSGTSFPSQRSGEGSTTGSSYQPPSSIPRMPSPPQSFSQSFNPADYGLSRSPHQSGSIHSQPGSAQGRNAFFDSAAQGSNSQPGSARGRNTSFDPAGYGMASRDPAPSSGYGDRSRDHGQRSPDLSGYGLGPPTPPQQPASPQHQPNNDPFVQATLAQINTGANAQRSPPTGNPFASEGQPEQRGRTDFEQSVMAPTVPLDSTAAPQEPYSEPLQHDQAPAQQQQQQQQQAPEFQRPTEALSRYSISESTAPLNEPVRPTRNLLSGDAPGAASGRSTYNDDEASTTVQPSEASFDGDESAQQPYMNASNATESPASGSRFGTSAGRRPEFSSTSVQPVQEEYDSAREPESEYAPASHTADDSDGDARSAQETMSYASRSGHTADESEESAFSSGRAARSTEAPVGQLSSPETDRSPYDRAPARERRQQDASSDRAAGTVPSSSSTGEYAGSRSNAEQPAVTEQVQVRPGCCLSIAVGLTCSFCRLCTCMHVDNCCLAIDCSACSSLRITPLFSKPCLPTLICTEHPLPYKPAAGMQLHVAVPLFQLWVAMHDCIRLVRL